MSRNRIGFVALVAALIVLLAPAANAAKSSPTLWVTFPTASVAGVSMAYGTPFVVAGCGYGSTYTSVVVRSPEALSFAGQEPGADGCISFTNFSTNASGTYVVDAYQQIHGHSSRVAS